MDPIRPARLLVALAAAGLVAPAAAQGFQNVREGDPLEPEVLPALDGPAASYLGRARANVFVFFRPGQDHSLDLLRRLAGCERDFAGKSVRWVAIVSDGPAPDEVRAFVREAGVRMPVLVDRGDALYGKLGVRLHPVLGIADAEHRLVAYEHFRKINMEDIVRARVRRLLGEIGDAELAAALDPPKATMPDDDVRFVAKRDVNLAKMLLARGNFEKALEAARKGQERDPTFSAPHAVAGQALAGLGRCAEALAEFEAALRLDPRDAAAAEGRKSCAR